MRLLEKQCYAKRISPLDGEYFFGYYDVQPFNGNLHLTHKIKDSTRLHVRGDRAEIGLLNTDTAKYEQITETGAWNFQQGSMLQWNPASPKDEIIFNSLVDGGYNATIMNINTGKTRFLDRPVANVSPKGDYALSINFGRLYNFRPGYGYAEYGDPFYHVNHSDKDGVFLTDMKTGKSRLIISMQQIWDFTGSFFAGQDQKLVINHITFNTDGSRFLFLVRNFPSAGQAHKTAVVTANTDGSDMYLLSDYGVQSHYHWMDEKKMVFFAGGRELDCSIGWGNNYIMTDKTHEGEIIADGHYIWDNHMSFSPDRKLLLIDSYPDHETRMSTVKLYSFEKNTTVELGRFYSIDRGLTDLRCDLHPRWRQDGLAFSFDSTHEGQRGVYMMDVSDKLDTLFD